MPVHILLIRYHTIIWYTVTVGFSTFIALDGVHSPPVAIVASSVCVLLTFLILLTLTATCSIMIIRKKKSSESKKLYVFLSPNSCLLSENNCQDNQTTVR